MLLVTYHFPADPENRDKLRTFNPQTLPYLSLKVSYSSKQIKPV